MWNLNAKFNLDFISAPDWLSFLCSLFYKRPALLQCHVVNDILGTDGDVPVFTMEQYPNFNFVETEAVQELGINSGGSNEAQVNDPGYEESFVLLDDDMMMMIAMIAFQMGST